MAAGELHVAAGGACVWRRLSRGIPHELHPFEQVGGIGGERRLCLDRGANRVDLRIHHLKFHGAAAAAHTQRQRAMLAFADIAELQFQFSIKQAAGFRHVLCLAEYKGEVVASRGNCLKQICLYICGGQRALAVGNRNKRLCQYGDARLSQDLADLIQCRGKRFCVHDCFSYHHAALLRLSKTACIRRDLVENSLWRTIFSPCARML